MAVRSSKYKLIRYTSDGGNPLDECILDSAKHEEELYDIGINRERDPNEWNNLAQDSNYLLIKKFLSQWLPDSVMYLKKAYSVTIEDQLNPCLFQFTDTIKLTATIFDTIGTQIDLPEGFILKWHCSYNNIILEGNDILFPIITLTDERYENNNYIMFTAVLTDVDGNIIYGIDNKYYYINPFSAPEADFTVTIINDSAISSDNISLTGTYSEIWWNMGDGGILTTEYPDVYTYEHPGFYTVTCNMRYGNGDDCVFQQSYEISTNAENLSNEEDIVIFPNPAESNLHIFCKNIDSVTDVSIYSSSGMLVCKPDFSNSNDWYITFDISLLPSGVYVLTINHQEFKETGIFVVAHQN
jgi:hypothetical protein